MPIIKTTKQIRTRDDRDYYPTPDNLVDATIDRVILDGMHYLQLDNSTILDPGAGSGSWGRGVKRAIGNVNLVGVDSNFDKTEPYDVWHKTDYITYDAQEKPYMVIGNPPYKLAEEFVRKSISISERLVVFLLRLAFLESYKRANGLWKKHPPESVWVLGRRPSFTGDGKTDATAYAIYVWDKTCVWSKTSLTWLNW